jgi:hypothetical protein
MPLLAELRQAQLRREQQRSNASDDFGDDPWPHQRHPSWLKAILNAPKQCQPRLIMM